ncbi:NAD(P)H-quinone oxidoreductase [Aureimonas mangrovi]|uniref:NAD(P)H-quinone oxidoreductase n=1 Tax=Aureimonas mangrovi TaxID=2758041 RepID=UPI00163DAD38|nr:NAD(P)H-quinone oxidoreductase [Aureimonas mangrovi]
MTETMKAIVATRPGGPEVLVLEDRPKPSPAPGEVLIEVAAAGVNRPDLRQRLGHYPPPPGIVDIIGLEIAGTIVDVGRGVDRSRIGEGVCALLAGGGYAQYAVAPEEQVLSVPSGLSMIEAAALPETFFTVWTNLFRIGRLAPKETVLVHGGASGIGTTAIQLAKAHGARVIATAGGARKVDACRSIGADVAIDYKSEDFSRRILDETGGRGVDVILDLVCADYTERNLSCLAVGGRLVIIAFLGGGQAMVDLEKVVRRRQTITGSTLRPQTPAEKGAIATDLREIVWPWIKDGKVRPVIQSTHPMRDASSAHAELEAGGHVGKIVLVT